MNRILKTTVAALALSLAGAAAFAQSASGPLTREQVKAELAAARADGSMTRYDNLIDIQAQHIGSHLSGSQNQARASAQPATITQASGGLTREQVKAEVVAALHNGELNPFSNMDNFTNRQPARAVTAATTLAQSH
jgi:hypothetical protein